MPMALTPILTFLSTPSARRATFLLFWCSVFSGFLSTPSARRATAGLDYDPIIDIISIHALREEGD